MRGVVYHGPHKLDWEEVAEPQLVDSTDVIVRVETTTICGSDLHILHGDVPDTSPPRVLGHEGIGVVEEVGSAVQRVAAGDRVLMACVSACGHCRMCRSGLLCQCLNGGGWVLGHTIDGVQADYVRVPYADVSTHKLPEGVTDEDALFLSDIMPTSYEVGVRYGRVGPGDTVAIVGCGPVGLAAVMNAQLVTPQQIIALDVAPNRLEVAARLGADVTIDSSQGDAVERILDLTDGLGVDVAIEAVGVPETFELCAQLIRPGGRLANIGVHGAPATLHLEELWAKSITITTGIVPTFEIPTLMRLIQAGRLDPKQLITHRYGFDDFMEAYDAFSKPAETGALKVVLSRG